MAAADRSGHRTASGDDLEQPMRVTTPVGWLLVGVLAVLIVGGAAWSAVVDIPISIKGRGLLVDRDGIDQISAPSRGSLVRLLVAAGDRVREGDVVAEIDQPELRAQIANRQIALSQGLKRRNEQLEFSRQARATADAQEAARVKAATEKQALAEERLGLLRQREKGIERLAASGVIAHDRWLTLKAEIAQASETVTAARNELDLARADRAMREGEREREDAKIEHELAEMRSQLAGLIEQHQLNSQVRVRFPGRIIEQAVSIGDFVNAGQAIFTTERSIGDATEGEDLTAMVFVKQGDGKRIAEGMVVQVAPGSVDRAEHGFARGRVREVAHDPMSSAGLTQILRNDQLVRSITQELGSPLLVLVDLERDPDTPTGFAWSTSRGPEDPLHTGDSVEAEFTVQQRKLLGLLIPAVARFLVDDRRPDG